MSRPRAAAAPDGPKVLSKALLVLEAFRGQSPEWSEVELRPASWASRRRRSIGFCAASRAGGNLLRYGDGRYRLGLAAVRLGDRARESIDLAAALDPEIRAAARETGS